MATRALPLASEAEAARLGPILLVQPPIGGSPADITPPIGLLILAAVLEAEGRPVELLDLNLRVKRGDHDASRSLRSQFAKALPEEVGLVGVSTWSYNFAVAMEFVDEVKKRRPRAPVVLGGPHVTFVDVETLDAFPKVDYVLRDEGDHTFPRLLRAIEAGADPEALAAIPGLTWRRDGAVVRNPSGSVVEDLDALPHPAYHLIDVEAYLALSPVLVVEAGRGCPYNCNFCSTTNMFQRKYRVKSPARLVDELEWAVQATGTRRFELLHDNLVASKKHVLAVCAEIRRRNLDVEWSCTSRTDNITEEVAHQMFLAGCEQVFFGVESIDPGRQAWTGKGLKPHKVHEALELTARQHLRPAVGIIVGFPDETPEELDATVRAAVRWATDPKVDAEISTAVLRYYPGADLFADADSLRFDPRASALSAAVPGYRLRKGWQTQTRLFPLHAIHTTWEETRRNMLRVNHLRTLLALAPLTLRACLDLLGRTPTDLLDALAAAGSQAFLERADDRDLVSNETLLALGAVVREAGDERVLDLLDWEVPFWQTRPVSPPLDHLEHVVHAKRFVHEDLLKLVQGLRAEKPRREAPGQSVVGVRAGREVFVAITPDPDGVLFAFRRRLGRR
jgi:radical SAM superfamily enzyme YgiQ (UPF0313 family)